MDYSPELADAICELISSGESIRTICRAEDMPAMSSIFKWLRMYPDFTERYARAKEAQAELYADELILICDDASRDVSGELQMPNSVAVQRDKLRVDTRKWLLSKLLMKKYGDKLQHSGDPDAPIEMVVRRIGGKIG